LSINSLKSAIIITKAKGIQAENAFTVEIGKKVSRRAKNKK